MVILESIIDEFQVWIFSKHFTGEISLEKPPCMSAVRHFDRRWAVILHQ